MNFIKTGQQVLLVAILGCYVTPSEMSWAQTAADSGVTNEIRIVELQGTVEVSPAGAKTWVLTQTNQVLHPSDRLRTGTNSRVALCWSQEDVVPFGASTELEILPLHSSDVKSGLHLVRGVVSFFHRDRPGHICVMTRGAVAGMEGGLAGDELEPTVFPVIDANVRSGNEPDTLLLTNGQHILPGPDMEAACTADSIADHGLE